jgi:hypothetical protein
MLIAIDDVSQGGAGEPIEPAELQTEQDQQAELA